MTTRQILLLPLLVLVVGVLSACSSFFPEKDPTFVVDDPNGYISSGVLIFPYGAIITPLGDNQYLYELTSPPAVVDTSTAILAYIHYVRPNDRVVLMPSSLNGGQPKLSFMICYGEEGSLEESCEMDELLKTPILLPTDQGPISNYSGTFE